MRHNRWAVRSKTVARILVADHSPQMEKMISKIKHVITNVYSLTQTTVFYVQWVSCKRRGFCKTKKVYLNYQKMKPPKLSQTNKHVPLISPPHSPYYLYKKKKILKLRNYTTHLLDDIHQTFEFQRTVRFSQKSRTRLELPTFNFSSKTSTFKLWYCYYHFMKKKRAFSSENRKDKRKRG